MIRISNIRGTGFMLDLAFSPRLSTKNISHGYMS